MWTFCIFIVFLFLDPPMFVCSWRKGKMAFNHPDCICKKFTDLEFKRSVEQTFQFSHPQLSCNWYLNCSSCWLIWTFLILGCCCCVVFFKQDSECQVTLDLNSIRRFFSIECTLKILRHRQRIWAVNISKDFQRGSTSLRNILRYFGTSVRNAGVGLKRRREAESLNELFGLGGGFTGNLMGF